MKYVIEKTRINIDKMSLKKSINFENSDFHTSN